MRAASAAVVPAALALTACGGGSGGALSLDPIARAADKTVKKESVKVDTTMSGGGISGRGTGVFDNDPTGAGEFSMDLTYEGRSVHMDAVLLHNVIYLKSPIFHTDPTFPSDKDWLKLDFGKLARVKGTPIPHFENFASPKSGLAFLRAAKGSAKKLGTETVRGLEATHYSASVDLQSGAERTRGDTAKGLRSLRQLLGTRTVRADVWIDHEGLVRKETYPQLLGVGGPVVTITDELYNFGPRVPISAPPANKVLDGTKVAASGG